MVYQILFAGLFPAVMMAVFYFYLRFKYPEGNLTPFLYSFFFGVIVSIFVIFLEMVVDWLGYAELKSLRRTAFNAFVVKGFFHQAAVFSVIAVLFLRKKFFRSPADGIVYATGIALGLSVVTGVDNVIVYGKQPFFWQLLISFPFALIITATPVGFFSGLAVNRKNRLIDLTTGLFIASFFLGLYMFCLYTREEVLWFLSGIATFFISLLLIYKAVTTGWVNK